MRRTISVMFTIVVIGIGSGIGCKHMSSVKKPAIVEPINSELPATPDMVIEKVASLQMQVSRHKGSEEMASIRIKLFPQDAAKFAEITGNHIGEQMAICVDKEIISQPVIREKITAGVLAIFSSMKKKETEQLVRKMRDKKIELYLVKKK